MKNFCSIIIPFKNSKKTLKKCIGSVLAQQGKINYEIILVDDFSIDGSKILCSHLIKNKKNCKLLKSKIKTFGPGHARNIGIKESDAEYIFFLDSDDMLRGDAIDSLYQISKKENYPDLICANYKLIDQIGNFKKKNRYDLKLYNDKKKKILLNFFNLSIIPQVISNLIKKEIIKKNKLIFQKGFFEDVFFYFKVLYFSKKIKILKKKIYFKINRKNSIVNSITENHLKDSFNNYNLCYKFLYDKRIIKKYDLKKYFLKSITGQTAVFLERISDLENYKVSTKLKDLLRKIYSKLRQNVKFNYIFVTKKDIIAKKFLYYNK